MEGVPAGAFGYLEGMPLPAVALDAGGRVIGLNTAFSGLLGLAKGEPAGADWSGLTGGGEGERVLALLQGLEANGSATLAISLIRRDAKRVRVQAYWSRLPTGPSPRYLGLLVVLPSPSEGGPRGVQPDAWITGNEGGSSGWKSAPGRIDPARRNQIIHTIIFHDAKNRLAALHGYASLLRESLSGPGVPPYVDKLEELGSDLERDLGVASILSHLGLIEPRWQNLREIIGRIASREEPWGGISLEGLPASLFCLADPFFPRVFSNLFEHARRHGERVTVIRITAREEDTGLVISVEDDGIGIPADQKEKIFELGFGRRTGYCLYLAREILSMGGFSIRETGDPGRGARFEICIPKGRYSIHPPVQKGPDILRAPAV
jgi:signal transduction histidine kinase